MRLNIEPRPTSLTSWISPCRSAAEPQIASPRPVPVCSRVRDPSSCWNFSKILLALGRVDPRAVVDHADADALRLVGARRTQPLGPQHDRGRGAVVAGRR